MRKELLFPLSVATPGVATPGHTILHVLQMASDMQCASVEVNAMCVCLVFGWCIPSLLSLSSVQVNAMCVRLVFGSVFGCK
jgi:hypothetical protein